MINLREYRNIPDRLSDLLNWAALIAPGVILNKDGSLQTTIKYRGPDLESATEAELVAISARLNNILKRLGSGWAIFAEAQRQTSSQYPAADWPDPISELIDQERRELFQRQNHFESFYFLTFVYLPPPELNSRLRDTFIESAEVKGTSYERLLSSFQSEMARIIDLMETLFAEVTPLSDEDTLSYLHGLISDKQHRVSVPENPIYLDALMSDTALIPGFEPVLGSLHLRIVSILTFPGRSQPGLFDALNRLSIEYRWVTRFLSLDKTDALSEITRYKKRWFAKRKGIVTLLKEVLTNSESIMTDSDAVNKALDADEAMQELADDAVSYGYFTACIVTWSKDAVIASQNAQEIERVINSLGFVSRVEDVNAVDAWLGTLPGNCRNNVRRPILNTLNLSHLMPLSAVWAGPEVNEHLDGPPLFYAVTSGSTPFRFSPYVGDVGHTLVLGPSGSGKSVLLNLMEASFLRYPDAQVYIFDKGGSARVITAGVGADYYNLGAKDSPLCFQPFADIDREAEKRWAHEWLLQLLTQEKVENTPHVKEELWKALTSLASAKREERTLFGLTVLLQNDLLRRALLPYTIQGAHGQLLDNTEDTLSYGRWQCFEMEVLMDTPSVVMPVLSYLFHRLEQRFNGRPTILVLDEAWLFLDNPAFSSKIREWLKVLRKANVMVVFATQSLADVDQSAIAPTIKEACFTKVYLPNPAALNEDVAHFYERFGLNKRQIEILAFATPKRDYYYTSPLGNRLFELELGPIALAYCGATNRESQLSANILLENTASVLEFNQAYLEETLGKQTSAILNQKEKLVA